MALYALTVTLSAFLLLLIQPIAGKILLPVFGGSAWVWLVCLLFFQCVLLGGYLYSHALSRIRSGVLASRIHLACLALSVAALVAAQDFQPLASWRWPAIALLWSLAVLVGLPYFALSTTTPLVQSWYYRQQGTQIPYRLFAFSNAGSLAALAAYPFLVEPFLGLRLQELVWGAGFLIFVVLCGVVAARNAVPEYLRDRAEGGAAPSSPSRSTKAIWMLLAGTGSALLLATTNLLTKDVAPVPLLWIAPLSLYLLSFVLCFAQPPLYHHGTFNRLVTFGLFALAYGMAYAASGVNLPVLLALACLGLFVCCMFCHGELALLKPPPEHLTSFYLALSAGGALGAVAVALVAPYLFKDYYEYPFLLATCASLAFHQSERNVASLIRLLLTLLLIGYVSYVVFTAATNVIFSERNFYGPLKVMVSGEGEDKLLVMLSGTITHGSQFAESSRRREATSYYGPRSGGGLAILSAPSEPRRVGLVGLGPGTMAVYARPGDYFRFYELNPLVIEVAQRYFTYLKDCEARVDIVEGDARVNLEREPAQNFDVLILDAFSGDSIPTHLLTREAFGLYFRHLKPQGVVAVHVSNRFLDLAPMVAAICLDLGKYSVKVTSPSEPAFARHSATWVLASADPERLRHPLLAARTSLIPRPAKLRVWTDDYSNLLQVLK